MTFILPQLSYAYDALEPHIDAQTMEIHHSKHHQTYVDKLNAAVASNADWSDKSIEELLQSVDILPSDIKGAVKNHGG
jgi:superoxide dismutase, Fe-Mn family